MLLIVAIWILQFGTFAGIQGGGCAPRAAGGSHGVPGGLDSDMGPPKPRGPRLGAGARRPQRAAGHPPHTPAQVEPVYLIFA